MRFAILFCATVVANVYGEKFSVSMSMGKLSEEMKVLQFNGEGRAAGLAAGTKEFVESMLAKVEKNGRLDDDAKDTLVDISGMLSEILALFRDQKRQDQDLLNFHKSEATKCHELMQSNATNWENEVDTTRTNHTICRDQQLKDHDDHEKKCNDDLLTFLQGVDEDVGDKCKKFTGATALEQDPNFDLQQIDNWGKALRALNDTVQDLKTDFEGYNEPCKTAFETLEATKAQCELKQRKFETEYCEWRFFTIHRCAQVNSCVDNQERQFNRLISTKGGTNVNRVIEAKKVAYVKCLVDKLIEKEQNDFDSWLNECGNVTNDLNETEYHYILPEFDNHTVCQGDTFDRHPGFGGFDITEYQVINETVRPNVIVLECDKGEYYNETEHGIITVL